jgi:putative ABC transport system permease protein
MTKAIFIRGQLGRWLLSGEWRAYPVRTIVAISAIALGVALGFAIDLINAAAFNEFSAAVKSISGQSDLQIRNRQAFFNESIYPLIAQHEGVAVASPVVEVDAAIPGEKSALKILGIDVFRAAAIAPNLIGVPPADRAMDVLADDAIFLSPAAMEWLKVKTGDTLRLRSGAEIISLRVAGGLKHARAAQRIAVMDIGAAQWRFNRLGQLSHIDVRLVTGTNRNAFKNKLANELPSQYLIVEPQDQEARSSNMSRAYRVNLNVLALVALFTGAFLVFSTQTLSIIRRRGQFTLLRVVGLTRRQLLTQVLVEGTSLGILGSVIGLALGYMLASMVLHFFGGDLGGGYFPGVKPTVQFAPVPATIFFLLGCAVALLGSLVPALEAARAKPAQALKSGSEDVALSKLATPWPALLFLLLGIIFTQLPPVSGLPIFGYLAVACLLIGGIALMPRFTATLFASIAAMLRPTNAVSALVLARLKNAPNQASIALGGVLSSFSLMAAMAIMVASFRVSVDNWLVHVLPADLYVRSATSGDTGTLQPSEQQAIARTPGVQRISFLRTTPLTLDPDRPAVILLARTIDLADPGEILPLVGPTIAQDQLRDNAIPVWVSEAMVDLYGYTLGKHVHLPIAGGTHDYIVAGIWRDYARQSGAIQMRLSDYQALTGDRTINDSAVWLQPGETTLHVISELRHLPFGANLEFSQPGEIRAASLKIFDRSFVVTYLLELVAIVIGLFGVAATFSAQTLARAKEFGMLRHVGVTRGQVLAILAMEGSLLTVAGIIAGFLLGLSIALILVFVVNPQSFHWTMQLHMPWPLLAAVALVLLLSAAATALIAGRYAVSRNAVQVVREDW